MVELLKERLVPEDEPQQDAITRNVVTSLEEPAAGQADDTNQLQGRLSHQSLKEGKAVSFVSGPPYSERKSTFQVGSIQPTYCKYSSMVRSWVTVHLNLGNTSHNS
jgi:hypothetical protein